MIQNFSNGLIRNAIWYGYDAFLSWLYFEIEKHILKVLPTSSPKKLLMVLDLDVQMTYLDTMHP